MFDLTQSHQTTSTKIPPFRQIIIVFFLINKTFILLSIIFVHSTQNNYIIQWWMGLLAPLTARKSIAWHACIRGHSGGATLNCSFKWREQLIKAENTWWVIEKLKLMMPVRKKYCVRLQRMQSTTFKKFIHNSFETNFKRWFTNLSYGGLICIKKFLVEDCLAKNDNFNFC